MIEAIVEDGSGFSTGPVDYVLLGVFVKFSGKIEVEAVMINYPEIGLEG